MVKRHKLSDYMKPRKKRKKSGWDIFTTFGPDVLTPSIFSATYDIWDRFPKDDPRNYNNNRKGEKLC